MKIADLEVIRLRSPEHTRPLEPTWTPGGSRTRSEATPVRVDADGNIVAPSGPGLGVQPDAEKIAKFRVG